MSTKSCVDYYEVGSFTSVARPIGLLQLASYIASDWLPGVPNSVVNGFGEVLGGVLEKKQLRYPDYHWCVKRDLARTDRQWRGATSWILGVAFARFAMECEGYIWWAPLSAFSGPTSTGKTATGYWVSPAVDFSIRRDPASSVRLLPDYAACRLSGATRDYAFVESKGTTKSMASLRIAPADWSKQVRSAELLLRGRTVPVGRHLVVGTRVYPEAVQASTRKVTVRLWNANEGTEPDGDLAFAVFLALHYAAMCRRLGFGELEDLMTFAAEELSWIAAPPSRQKERRLQSRDARIRAQFGDVDLRRRISRSVRERVLEYADEQVMLPPESAPAGFRLDERAFAIGFTREALEIMTMLAELNYTELPSVAMDAVSQMHQRLAHYQGDEEQNIALLLNGVAVFAAGQLQIRLA